MVSAGGDFPTCSGALVRAEERHRKDPAWQREGNNVKPTAVGAPVPELAPDPRMCPRPLEKENVRVRSA